MERVGALCGIVLLCLAGVANAEDVKERAKAPSSHVRLRGAVGLVSTPSGLLTLGGSKLRHLPPGAKGWKVLLEVRGKNLYRVAENRGRVLASYEDEPFFHVVDVKTGKRRTIVKPPTPTDIPGFQDWNLDWIDFTEDGRDALVYMGATAYLASKGSYDVVGAYRVPLDGRGAPIELFREEGFRLRLDRRGAVLLKPRSWARGCFHKGCPVDEIVAFELAPRSARRRVILDGRGKQYGSAQIVPSAREDAIAVQVTGWDEAEKRPTRGLLRYAYGGEPTFHPLSDWHAVETDLAMLRRNADYVEARQDGEKSVTITRVAPDGGESQTVIPSWGDRLGRPAKMWLRSINERRNGDLWMHWGPYLVVVDDDRPRRFDVSGHLGRSTEWAGAYVYVEEPEMVWFGIEVGGGRDYVRIEFDEIDRKARPWQPATMPSGYGGPMPPEVATHLSGRRTERKLGAGLLSIGESDLYFRRGDGDSWKLLHALPGRSIYRMDLDEDGGRFVAHWSSERRIHLFEPGRDVHRTYPWPLSDVEGFNAGLQHLFFAPNGGGALVAMRGLVRGKGSEPLNELYRVPFDGGPPRLIYRHQGYPLHVSERGATLVEIAKNGGQCNVKHCVVDLIHVVDVEGDDAKARVVFQRPSYTDHASRVPGSDSDAIGVVVQYSDPVDARNPVKQRELLRFSYGDPTVTRMRLPPYGLEAVKRNHLTESGDYIELVALAEAKVLRMEIHRKGGDGEGARIWELPVARARDLDAGPDGTVHGFGQRDDGRFWLHWGDRLFLLDPGKPARAVDLSNRLVRGGEWGSADTYRADPETLTIAVDVGGGRTWVDVALSAIEREARRVGR